MNPKIYIIATAENKHLIIPYLESLGGVNKWGYDSINIEEGECWFIILGNIEYYNHPPEGYTEYKFPEQPSEQKPQTIFDLMDKDPNSEIDLLKKENEQLRENQIPEHLKDFVNEVQYMIGLYQAKRFTNAELTKNKLCEALDDLMRIEPKRTYSHES